MAGHSKWANTKRRKAAQDTKKGKIFTKIIREIVNSARIGGCDVNSNYRLRAAVEKALFNNMTRDTIKNAISRGVGGNEITVMDHFTYEGYGPGGTAIMVKCLSDNRNRTVSEIRYAFTKNGGNLGTYGSVSYLFKKIGIIKIDPDISETYIMDVTLEAGAEDVISYKDCTIVYTTLEKLYLVKKALKSAGIKPEYSEVNIVACNKINLDLNNSLQLLKLIDILEYSNDVQEVYHNGNITDNLS